MYYFRKLKNSKLLIAIMSIIIIFTSLIISTIDDYTEFVNQQKNLDENNISFNFALDLNDEEKVKVLSRLYNDEEVNLMIQGSQVRFEPGTFSVGMNLNVMNYDMPIIEGRFFNEEDFNNDKKEVVIGKEILISGIVSFENGEKYINRGVDKYKVIGIVGDSKKRTYYDYHLFYKINNLPMNSIKNCTFSITNNDISINDLGEKLHMINSEIGKDLFINTMIIEGNNGQDTFTRAVGIGGLYLIFYVSAFICAVLTYLLALINYINNIKSEIILRKVHGATKLDLFYEILMRYLLISIVSLIISVIVVILINNFSVFNGSYINLKSISFISIFNIIVIIGSVFILISQIYMNKFQPVEILKEK